MIRHRLTTASVLLVVLGLCCWMSGGPARAEEANDDKEVYRTRLFFADLDGSNLKPVVQFAEYHAQGSPNWSPDGQLIGFDGWKPQKGEEFSASRVIVVNVDGTNPRRFEGAAMPSFSPDSKWIVFSSPTQGGVWFSSVSNQSEQDYQQVDPAGWGADWSRDGRIVYSNRTQAGANMRVVKCIDGRLDTDSAVDVFGEGKAEYVQVYWNMAWSADSQRIAYKAMTKDKKVVFGIVDARGEKFGHVTRDEGDMLASFAWSPDGSRVLFVKKQPDKMFYQVFAAAPDKTDAPQPLAGLDPFRPYSDIAYAPDGKRLLITCGKRMLPEKPAAQ